MSDVMGDPHSRGSAANPRPPRLRGGLPLLGHIRELGRNPVLFLTRVREQCGDIGMFRILTKDMVLFSGPQAQAAFFHAPDSQLSPKDAYQKMMAPVFGEGVVYDAPSPEVMLEHIAMTFPALREKRLRTYVEQIVHETELTLAEWGDAGELDLLEYATELTLRTAAATLMGPEIRSRLSSKFAPLYHDLEGGISPIAFAFPRLPIPAFRRRDAALQRLQDVFSEIVASRRRSGWQGEDFLQTLMVTQYKDGRALTDQEITGLLIAMLFAGHHTSSATLAWTILELLAHPGYLPPLLEEVEGESGRGRRVDFDSLKDMTLLDNAVRETLRLHPPLIMLIRKVVTDFEYGRYRVPAGSFALTSPAVSHSIPESFPQPNDFEPNRYRPERAEDKSQFAYVPFGGGHHRCPGMRFGLLQVKAVLSVLLQRYEIVLVEPNYEPDFSGMVVVPKQPCRVRYRRRLPKVDAT